MKTKTTYSIEELKSLLEEFEANHPCKGEKDELYVDVAMRTSLCAEEFLTWVEERNKK